MAGTCDEHSQGSGPRSRRESLAGPRFRPSTSCASDHTTAIQAQPALPSCCWTTHGHIGIFLARAVEDIREAGASEERRVIAGAPLCQGLVSSHVEHSDLEPQTSKTRLAWRALISRQSHSCEATRLPGLVQVLSSASIQCSIQDQQMLSDRLSLQELVQGLGERDAMFGRHTL